MLCIGKVPAGGVGCPIVGRTVLAESTSKRRIYVKAGDTAVRPFYRIAVTSVCGTVHRHDAVYLYLRHCGWLVRIQFCGQNCLCGGKPYYAAADAHRHGWLYAGNRRLCHCSHHLGRGGQKKGRQLFQPVSDRCLSSRRGIGGLGAGDPAPCGGAAGGKGRNAGICPAIRADSAGKRAYLHFAEYVSEFFL